MTKADKEKGIKKKEGEKFDKVVVIYAEKYFDWQLATLQIL